MKNGWEEEAVTVPIRRETCKQLIAREKRERSEVQEQETWKRVA